MNKTSKNHPALPQFSKKTCLIIYSGGTLGMELSDQGLAVGKTPLETKMKKISAFYDSEHSYMFGEGFLCTPLIENTRVYYKVLQYKDLIDSSDMNFDKYLDMARTIKDNYESYDSFMVIHGTDTLEYTSAILSFMIDNLEKTIILTGSQIPLSDHKKNDAFSNLQGCFRVISNIVVPEVCVYFRECLLRGNRIKKVDSSDLNAFISPSYPPLASDHQIDLKVYWEGILRRKKGDNSNKGLIIHEGFNNHFAMVSADGSFNMNRTLSLLKNDQIKVLIFRVASLSSALHKFSKVLQEAAIQSKSRSNTREDSFSHQSCRYWGLPKR